MREFGSDFHIVNAYKTEKACPMDVFSYSLFLADGRQCIEALIRQFGWKRLWMPAYFCYNIIEYLQKNIGIEIVFYIDYPGNDDRKTISELCFQEGDVLLRMNYFGLRSYRSTKGISVPVIEDHSHDLIGDWARNSDADWCIASLRKIIPIPEGGVLWSPKGYKLDCYPGQSASNMALAQKRWLAMEEKGKYIAGLVDNKDSFRGLYLETENALDDLEISSIDERSRDFICHFNLNAWYKAKNRNWKVLSRLSSTKGITAFLPESEELTPFSFIVLFENHSERERVRKELINTFIYPAVLWNVSENVDREVSSISKRMLSIHCDGRYNESEMQYLLNTINTIIQNDKIVRHIAE